MVQDGLRRIPSVHRLLGTEPLRSLDVPAPLREAAVAGVLDELRRRARAGGDVPALPVIADAVAAAARSMLRPSLVRVINATGIALHTNLGRSPLAPAAVAAVVQAARGYSNLELDLQTGRRGSRRSHLGRWLERLTGAERALVVNNNAAAVYLALRVMGMGREAVVSRGELVEIGGSFRMPDIMRESGVKLVEVGSTNRTRIADYERALGPETGLVLKVHRSNFRMTGFVEDVPVDDLSALARSRGLPLLLDVGSGLLDGGHPVFGGEPSVAALVRAGASVVTFSGDKLLGGPQAGIIVGEARWVEAMASHPMARALRVDKMTIAALEATLRCHADPRQALEQVPVLRMLTVTPESLRPRLLRLARRLRRAVPGVAPVIQEETTEAGGGSLPEHPIATVVMAVEHPAPERLERSLRSFSPPVLARIHRGRLLVDLRCVAPDEESELLGALVAALKEVSP